MHPAMYWKRLPDRSVVCHLCPHRCILQNGQMGSCLARQNVNGTLEALTYGRPIAIHSDPVEKKPLYHFFPGKQVFSIATSGCNLHCLHCQNWEISQQTHILETYQSPDAIIARALSTGCGSIAYTYTEPLVWYEYLLDIMKLARKVNLKNILVSAGYINKRPLLRLVPYIDAANIDLKSFSDTSYQNINGATLQPVLDTIETLHQHNIWLEITQLLIPGINTNKAMLSQTINWLLSCGMERVPIHFSRYHPAYKMLAPQATLEETVTEACQLAQTMGMNYVYAGNLQSLHFENTNCPACGTLLIERHGYKVKLKTQTLPQCDHCHHILDGRFE